MSGSNPSAHDHPHGDWQDHIGIERAWEGTAKINGHLAALLEMAGRHEEAVAVRHDEQMDLEEAQHAGEEAAADLIDDQIRRDLHLSPDKVLTKVRAAQAQIAVVVAAVYEAVHHDVSQHDPIRHEFDLLHMRLHEHLARPVERQDHAVALLEILERYLRLAQHFAESHEHVRDAWLGQIQSLAAVL